MARPKNWQVTILGLTGMNNLRETKGYLVNDAKMATPHTILNADVTQDGVVRPRMGHRKILSLSSPHSLWAGSVALCVSDNTLYKLDGQNTVGLATITTQPLSPMRYEERSGVVYLSNGFWSATYNTVTGQVGPWGLPVPTPPTVVSAPGSMPPGAYKLCYTRYSGGSISGNSGIVEVSWEGGLGGLQLVNRPSDCLAWITQPNGMEFFLAPVGDGGVISSSHYSQPLPTFGVCPPPPFTFMVWGHGRMWGVRGKELWYSDEFRPEYFRPHQRFPFQQGLVNCAVFDNGVYVNSLSTTWALAGRDPSKMTQHTLGNGAIPGDVIYAQVEGAGYEVSKHLSQVPSPVWFSRAGVIVGTHTGHLVHITETRMRINPRSRVAGLHRMREGRPQVLFTMSGPLTAEPDATALGDFKRGRLFVPAPVTISVRGGVVVSGQGEYE